MPSLKEEAIAILSKLSDDVDIADMMAELYFFQKARNNDGKPNDDVTPVEPVPRRPGRPRKQN